VLEVEGKIYAVAGRSMFLDGGMRLVCLDAQSGERISETVMDDTDPETGEDLHDLVRQWHMPVALPDILASDGRWLYMRSQRLDFEGNRFEVAPKSGSEQRGDDAHLFSPYGLLDDSWFHRAYWFFGRASTAGAGAVYRAAQLAPAGRMLVTDGRTVYGYGRKPQYFRWATAMEYHVFAADREPELVGLKGSKIGEDGKPEEGGPTRPDYTWSVEAPLLVRAMVLADRKLILAGPPDVLDEEEAAASLSDPRTRELIEEQDAALAGQRGGLLLIVDADDGQELAELQLDSPPVFDGMAVAGDRLYMATLDGHVICLAAQE
jgi:hypothetical protein